MADEDHSGDPPSRRLAFYALVLLAVYLSFLVLGPFLAALTWAVLFGILFRKMQARLAPTIGRNTAAVATTLVVATVIVAPAVMLVSAVAAEVPQVTGFLQRASQSAPDRIEWLWDLLRSRSPIALPEDPSDLIVEGGRRAITFLAPRAGGIVADLFTTFGSLLAMLFALFFMLRDGEALSRHLCASLPFPRHESERLIQETRDLVIASVGAGLLVSAVQGAIGGVAFWVLGLAAPVLWGVVMAICSLLPVVGAALVWVPTGIGLLLSGNIGRGIAMLLVGALGISMADNILRPLLLSGRTQVSGLVIFFGLLGGVAAFGFIGLVIGPIILVTTGRLLHLLLHPDAGDEPR